MEFIYFVLVSPTWYRTGQNYYCYYRCRSLTVNYKDKYFVLHFLYTYSPVFVISKHTFFTLSSWHLGIPQDAMEIPLFIMTCVIFDLGAGLQATAQRVSQNQALHVTLVCPFSFHFQIFRQTLANKHGPR